MSPSRLVPSSTTWALGSIAGSDRLKRIWKSLVMSCTEISVDSVVVGFAGFDELEVVELFDEQAERLIENKIANIKYIVFKFNSFIQF